MKVLMKKELRKVGKRGDIVDVSDGYGANYLIPNGFAVLYTEEAKKQYQQELILEAKKDAEERAKAQELAKRLEGITLEFEASAGRRGEMIGTVSNKEIIKNLKEKYDITIKKNMIVDKNVLVNGFGKTSLKVELYKGVYGEINVHVSLKEKK